MCKNSYTNDSNKNCNGWSNTDLDDCREKCFRREVPHNCSEPEKISCNFVIWAPLESRPYAKKGHCHLGKIDTCEDFVESKDYNVYELKYFSTRTSESAGMSFEIIDLLVLLHSKINN